MDFLIPDAVEMTGTIRAFDEDMRNDIHQRLKTTAEMIAKSAGASAEISINKDYPVTINHEGLTEQSVPTLIHVAGGENVAVGPKLTSAEDFSEYQKKIPGFFFYIGGTPKGTDPTKAAPNHSPRFYVDESGLLLGVRALAHLTVAYMEQKQTKTQP